MAYIFLDESGANQRRGLFQVVTPGKFLWAIRK